MDTLKQFVLAYKRAVRASVIDELSLKKIDLQAVEADHSNEHDDHYPGEMSALNLLAKK